MSTKESKLSPVPEVGKFYHFWDDGKTGPSRHYICKVEELITPEQAKETILEENCTEKPKAIGLCIDHLTTLVVLMLLYFIMTRKTNGI